MRVLLAGATGYIGQAVLRELVAQGHEVVALVRPGRQLTTDAQDSVTRIEVSLTDDADWHQWVPPVDGVISCLASRSGAPRDARQVEFEGFFSEL